MARLSSHLLFALLLCSSGALAQGPPDIDMYLTPGFVQTVTPGPDAAMWFTMATCGDADPNCSTSVRHEWIGRITMTGDITTFPLPFDPMPLGRGVYGLTAGPDGALWFTEIRGNRIGRMTTAGVVTYFPLPAPHMQPYLITVGSDGALWFTESYAIGRITTAGALSRYAVGDAVQQRRPPLRPDLTAHCGSRKSTNIESGESPPAVRWRCSTCPACRGYVDRWGSSPDRTVPCGSRACWPAGSDESRQRASCRAIPCLHPRVGLPIWLQDPTERCGSPSRTPIASAGSRRAASSTNIRCHPAPAFRTASQTGPVESGSRTAATSDESDSRIRHHPRSAACQAQTAVSGRRITSCARLRASAPPTRASASRRAH